MGKWRFAVSYPRASAFIYGYDCLVVLQVSVRSSAILLGKVGMILSQKVRFVGVTLKTASPLSPVSPGRTGERREEERETEKGEMADDFFHEGHKSARRKKSVRICAIGGLLYFGFWFPDFFSVERGVLRG
jgi:hypothetical protein